MPSTGNFAANSPSLDLGEAITFLVLVIFVAGFIVYRIRIADQLRQIENALGALADGDRARRVNLSSGPLKRVGDAVDLYADANAQRLNDAESTQSELEELVTRDRLTGIGNRLHFDQQIELEAARGKRYRVPVSVVLIDVDHFKRINDTFGHSVGDSILIDVTRRISSQLRDTDTIARWGGEEFAIIAPCTPMPGAESLAEKLRIAVAELPFDVVGTVTISAGVAQLLPGERARHWVARADRFLYQAKQLGRNRVCAHAESSYGSTPFILVWGEQFMTGNPKVDAEHADIFRLSNELVLLQPDTPLGQLVERLDALLKHITAHFQSEEGVLKELGCAEHEIRIHSTNHQGLLTQAVELRRRLLAGEIGLSELGDFIVRRIAVGHLVGADLPLFASIRPSATMPVEGTSTPSIRVKLQRALLG